MASSVSPSLRCLRHVHVASVTLLPGTTFIHPHRPQPNIGQPHPYLAAKHHRLLVLFHLSAGQTRLGRLHSHNLGQPLRPKALGQRARRQRDGLRDARNGCRVEGRDRAHLEQRDQQHRRGCYAHRPASFLAFARVFYTHGSTTTFTIDTSADPHPAPRRECPQAATPSSNPPFPSRPIATYSRPHVDFFVAGLRHGVAYGIHPGDSSRVQGCPDEGPLRERELAASLRQPILRMPDADFASGFRECRRQAYRDASRVSLAAKDGENQVAKGYRVLLPVWGATTTREGYPSLRRSRV
uniref:Uncharacterized protein n=1 Tax=Mycena chlorophos TaxID=658473 RepID=A0ABQ0L7D3_MYCCL|nr:predicted protein [Mycena chlorophos]